MSIEYWLLGPVVNGNFPAWGSLRIELTHGPDLFTHSTYTSTPAPTRVPSPHFTYPNIGYGSSPGDIASKSIGVGSPGPPAPKIELNDPSSDVI